MGGGTGRGYRLGVVSRGGIGWGGGAGIEGIGWGGGVGIGVYVGGGS